MMVNKLLQRLNQIQYNDNKLLHLYHVLVQILNVIHQRVTTLIFYTDKENTYDYENEFIENIELNCNPDLCTIPSCEQTSCPCTDMVYNKKQKDYSYKKEGNTNNMVSSNNIISACNPNFL